MAGATLAHRARAAARPDEPGARYPVAVSELVLRNDGVSLEQVLWDSGGQLPEANDVDPQARAALRALVLAKDLFLPDWHPADEELAAAESGGGEAWEHVKGSGRSSGECLSCWGRMRTRGRRLLVWQQGLDEARGAAGVGGGGPPKTIEVPGYRFAELWVSASDGPYGLQLEVHGPAAGIDANRFALRLLIAGREPVLLHPEQYFRRERYWVVNDALVREVEGIELIKVEAL
jgi:hypothetical protein